MTAGEAAAKFCRSKKSKIYHSKPKLKKGQKHLNTKLNLTTSERSRNFLVPNFLSKTLADYVIVVSGENRLDGDVPGVTNCNNIRN